MLAAWPVEEVWGIGAALAGRLRPLGVRSAGDLAALTSATARDVGTVVLERLVRELNGIACDDFTPDPPALKGTAGTRCFGEPVADRAVLREAMVRRAVRAAEKIRAQDLTAKRLIAFAHGSRFKPNAPSATRVGRLSPATNDPRAIAGMAGRMAEAMFEQGRIYTNCGVMLEGLEAGATHQADLFAIVDPRTPALLAGVDAINPRYGRNTLRLASEGTGAKGYDTKRAFKSPSWTTRIDQCQWDDSQPSSMRNTFDSCAKKLLLFCPAAKRPNVAYPLRSEKNAKSLWLPTLINRVQYHTRIVLDNVCHTCELYKQ